MRRLLAATLVAAALAMTVPVPAQAAETITVDASAPAATVNLIADAAKSILFRLDEADFVGSLDAASVRLRTANEPTMELALVKSGGTWSTLLPVSTPDLVKGPWTATFFGIRGGSSGDLATVPFQVTAADTQAPKLALAKPAQTIVLGPLDSVELNVSDTLLRRVTFTFGGLPGSVPLEFPYTLRGDLLPQGQSTVIFQATDRAGQSTTLTVVVDRDALAPRVALQMPGHAYAGGSLSILSLVREDGPHTLRLLSNGSLVAEVKVPGYASTETNRTYSFTLPVPANGTVDVQVEVIDRAGSRALAGDALPIEPPIVDAKAGTLRVEGGGPLYARDLVRLNATASQVGGVADLPLTVAIEVAGRSAAFVVDVGPGGSKGVTWESRLPAGRHTAHAAVFAPPSANETAPGNENATLELEVFLGRLFTSQGRFDIRAVAGLPSAAVSGPKAYPLTLVDSGRGIAYKFTTPANQTFTWDPLEPMDEPDTNTTSSSNGTSSETGGGRGAPAPSLLLALSVVALAAIVERRRD
ncbi:MAG TPA: hypothetical protein VM327_04685 [Candidatus Thermoplasmatota archaeon]|nr:hypothetical protein [Candidatus Thermoplasmatota archaeon]